MIAGEGPDGGDVVGVSAELPREVVAAETAWRRFTFGQVRHPLLQCRLLPASQDHADFQPFRRVGLAGGLCAGQGVSFATFQWMLRHGVSLSNDWLPGQ